MCVATKGSWHPTKNGDSGSLHVSEAKRSELVVKVRMQRRQADGNSFQSSCHLTGDVSTSEQRRPIETEGFAGAQPSISCQRRVDSRVLPTIVSSQRRVRAQVS